jgi:transposase
MMPEDVIGVDVSKDWIDVCRDGARVARLRPSAYADFAQAAVASAALVVFEASGGYDAALRSALDAAGAGYARVNPAQARFFARSGGGLAKTDRVDARMLWRLGRERDLRATLPMSPVLSELKALEARRRQLVAIRAGEKTRVHQVRDATVVASLARMVAHLDAEVATLDAAIAALIAADPDLAARAACLVSAPGVAQVTAAGLLAECPELGHIGAKEVAALAGLAPVAHDSGRHRGQRRIGGGRPVLRSLMYRAALSAAQRDPALMAMTARLKAAGKAPKQALIAAARKLLTTLNAMLRDLHPYAPAPA